MEKAGIRPQGDHEHINQEKSPEALHHGEQDQAATAKTCPDYDDFSGPEPINQVPHEGSFKPTLKAGRPVKEGNRRAAYSQVALQGEEKDGEAVVDDSRAHPADQGA